jgi:methylated-DNA-[protein]-cysteine S-methyltransferase
MTVYYTVMDSPLCPLLLTGDSRALTGLYMVEHQYGPEIDETWVQDDSVPPFATAIAQLTAYFAGQLAVFDLPLHLQGTPFQQRVWTALQTIPYGLTTSYGALAKQLGNPNGSRAVGLANGRNPISIIVPCHRVIGTNGQLVGYGGGLPRKKALLAFEAAVLAHGPQLFPNPAAAMLPEQHQLSLFAS